jgi:hypothetical protein
MIGHLVGIRDHRSRNPLTLHDRHKRDICNREGLGRRDENDPPLAVESGSLSINGRFAFRTTIVPENGNAMTIKEDIPDILLGKRVQSLRGLDVNPASVTSSYYDLIYRRKNHQRVMSISAGLTVKKLNMI